MDPNVDGKCGIDADFDTCGCPTAGRGDRTSGVSIVGWLPKPLTSGEDGACGMDVGFDTCSCSTAGRGDRTFRVSIVGYLRRIPIREVALWPSKRSRTAGSRY